MLPKLIYQISFTKNLLSKIDFYYQFDCVFEGPIFLGLG